MSSAQLWKSLFSEWPASFPKKGLVTSTLNEGMPFKSFMVNGDLLALERTNPDASGARFILLGFDGIDSVKFVDPLNESALTEAGFVGQLAKR